MIIKIVNENTLNVQIDEEIKIENYYKLQSLKEALHLKFPQIQHILFAYADLMIEVDQKYFKAIKEFLRSFEYNYNLPETVELVEIPVDYTYALDKEAVEEHTGLAFDEVIKKHTSAMYFVHFLGFTYGFAYLGGLDEQIAVPRKATPRTKIQKGSVGIAGKQTGIYPSDLPGGWQIIGRTFCDLYTEEDTLLKPGQVVKFIESIDPNKGVTKKVIPWPY